MSFLVDPALLVANGYAIGRIAPNERAERLLEAAAITGFLGTSVSLYANAKWTRPIWRLCRAESGRDWMLNSGIFRFEHARPSRAEHAAAAALFITYPLWLHLGVRLGRGDLPGRLDEVPPRRRRMAWPRSD